MREDYYENVVRQAIHSLTTDLNRPKHFEELAQLVGFSAFHFHRMFVGMVGESPAELARRLRLERAAQALLSTEQRILEIAFDAGYQTHESFTKAFQSAFGVTPSRFRELGTFLCLLRSSNGIHYQQDGQFQFTPRDTGGKNMNVQIVEAPPLTLICARHIGPYNQIGAAFQRLMGGVAQSGIPMNQGVAVYHDNMDETSPEALRSDAGMIVAEGTQAEGDLFISHLPGGRYAVYQHVGGYEGLGDAWARLCGEWFPHSGHEGDSRPCYEVYLNDCSNTPKEQLLTDIYLAIK